MSNPKYHSSSKFLGAVGENNTIIQIINSGAEFVRGVAGRVLHGLFSRGPSEELVLLKERNQFLRRQVEIEQQRAIIENQLLILEKERFSYQQLTDGDDARRQEKLIELKEQENQLYKQEVELKREFYQSFIGVIQDYQQSLLLAKSEELQAKWDLQNLPFYFSREETRRLLQGGTSLLILMAPPELPSDVQGFAGNLETEIEESLRDAITRYYSTVGSSPPVDFFRLFKRPIKPTEAVHVRELFVRPTLVLSSIITDQRVHITVTYPIDPNLSRRSLTDNQTVLKSWDWEELVEQLEADGKPRKEAIRVVRELITVIHVLVAGYFSDLYFLSLDPYHEPCLYQLIQEFPPTVRTWLQSYQDSLHQTQITVKTQALLKLASQSSSSFDFIGSIQAYRELTRLHPASSQHYYYLGDAINKQLSFADSYLEQAKHQKEAVTSYRKAFSIDGHNIMSNNYQHAFNFILVTAELAQQRTAPQKTRLMKIANDYCDKLFAAAKNDREIADFVRKNNLWYTKASLLLEDEEFSDALSWIECATAIEPDNGEIWLVRASIERSLNFPERAFVSIIRSFSIKTDYWKDENFREEAKLLSKGIVRSIQSGVEAVWGRFSK